MASNNADTKIPHSGIVITGLTTHDIRFPTSLMLDGSDAMHTDPDYSCAYVVLETNAGPAAPTGHGLTFTLGKGTEGTSCWWLLFTCTNPVEFTKEIKLKREKPTALYCFHVICIFNRVCASENDLS